MAYYTLVLWKMILNICKEGRAAPFCIETLTSTSRKTEKPGGRSKTILLLNESPVPLGTVNRAARCLLYFDLEKGTEHVKGPKDTSL